jgi:hypothetical protein
MAKVRPRIAAWSDAIDVIDGLNKIRYEPLGVLCGREVAQPLHDLWMTVSNDLPSVTSLGATMSPHSTTH